MKSASIFPVDAVWSSKIKKGVQEKFTSLMMDIMK